jgi:hypothetical protein
VNNALERMIHWLDSNKNQSIAIRKVEDGDIDHVNIRLSDTEIKDFHTVDDYITGKKLLLHGEGKIQTEGNEQDIPGHVYEIALSSVVESKQTEAGFELTTDRGSYTFAVSGS